MRKPTEFYTVAVYCERSKAWELMSDKLMDREDAVELVSDYLSGFASWQIVRVDLATGTAHDLTGAIMAEAADDSDDCSSYDAQRREAISAGHFS